MSRITEADRKLMAPAGIDLGPDFEPYPAFWRIDGNRMEPVTVTAWPLRGIVPARTAECNLVFVNVDELVGAE